MTQDELQQLKDKLLKEKKRLEDELSSIAVKDEKIEGNYKTVFEDLGDDDDENAQEYTEQERKLSIEHQLEDNLKDVLKALKRIEEEGYGICKYCKKEIPAARLMVRPESSSCIECKSVLQGS